MAKTGNGNGKNGNGRRKAITHAADVLIHLVAEDLDASHLRILLALDGSDIRYEFTRLDKARLQ